MKKKLNISTVVALMLMAAALTFTLTYIHVRNSFNSHLSTNEELMASLAKYAEVSKYIEGNYIGEYDENSLMDGAMSGMVEALGDRWSMYMTEEQYKRYLESGLNEYAGIGVTITLDTSGEGALVETVTKDSPADMAGIKRGDVILEIDGHMLEGMELDGIRSLIVGRLGETISILVRGEAGSERGLSVECVMIDTPPVSYELLDSGVGLIKIDDFEQKSSSLFAEAIDKLTEQGAGAFVIDLRGNPGGRVSEMVAMLDLLLGECETFVSLNRKSEERGVEYSDASKIDSPIAVIVNASSYSAAEYFPAVLQEYGRAVIVGEKTTGKGYSQQTIALSDGSALHLSTAEYVTPGRVSLANTGISPDIEVVLSEEKTELLLCGELSYGQDDQLQAALSALGGKTRTS